MNINKDLLGSEGQLQTDEALQEMYKELWKNEFSKPGNPLQALQQKVAPTPGVCIKTKDLKSNEKVFINVCTSSSVPNPPEITEAELRRTIESLEDPNAVVGYRVPMSIGEPHAELDKQNKGCTAYDVIINPSFLIKIQQSDVFLEFFMSIVIEGIDNKFQAQLEHKWILLKRKKFVGSIQEQMMRTRRLIQEMQPGTSGISTPSSEEPNFQILREPEEGHPEFLIAEIKLPKAERAKSISLDVGEDRLVLYVKPHLYKLDIFLPYKLIQEECGSQFNVKTKLLTVTMPVSQPHNRPDG